MGNKIINVTNGRAGSIGVVYLLNTVPTLVDLDYGESINAIEVTAAQYAAIAALSNVTATVVADTTPGNQIGEAMSGDLEFLVTPSSSRSTAASLNAITAGVTVGTIVVTLQTAAGEIHDWYDSTIAISAATTNTSSCTFTVASATATMVGGVVSIPVTYTGTAWAAADTCTLSVAQKTLMGYTITAKTFVNTLT